MPPSKGLGLLEALLLLLLDPLFHHERDRMQAEIDAQLAASAEQAAASAEQQPASPTSPASEEQPAARGITPEP